MSAGPADAWIRKVVFAGNQESAATQFIHAPRKRGGRSRKISSFVRSGYVRLFDGGRLRDSGNAGWH